jgi:hypothetical protein
MRDLPNEFYRKNIEIMAERYAKIAKKLGIVWANYFEDAKVFLKNDDYKIWAFLCGVEETFKEAADMRLISKAGAKRYIKKITEERLQKIRGKNDLELYLKNM